MACSHAVCSFVLSTLPALTDRVRHLSGAYTTVKLIAYFSASQLYQQEQFTSINNVHAVSINLSR